MKRIVLFALLFSAQFITAQDIKGDPESVVEAVTQDDNTIYNSAGTTIKPDFPGGIQKFFDFFNHNYQMPDEEGLKGRVFTTFVVEKDGSLSDIKILKDIGYGTGKEAFKVLKTSPKWIPGELNGRKVRVLYTISFPINSEMNSKTVDAPLKIDDIKDKK